MKRAHSIKPAGAWNTADAIDRVLLDADARGRRRIVLEGERGTAFLLDLPQVPALRDGDGLVLDDGRIVQVIGRNEPLTEIEAATPADRLRLAWHLGNRHTEVEVAGERLRIRRDHVLEAMLLDLGARLTHIEAPFHPERGAYAQGHETHPHAAPHAHDHG
jgi:urease accessory protein